MSKKVTHEDYVNEVAIKNPNIEVVGTYIKAKTPILHKCLIHNIEWNIAPNNVLQGQGCQECKLDKIKHKNSLSHDEYVNNVCIKNPDIEVVGTYINSKTKILHKCKIHNIEWEASPTNILSGCGCFQCKTDKLRMYNTRSHDEYIKELSIINPNILCKGIYVIAKQNILHQCLICGHEWNVAPSSLLSDHGCPHCITSQGEKYIKEWLELNNINYIPQMKFDDCRDKKVLPFDFYLPDLHKCIEYDGKQHYKSIDYFGGQEGFETQKYHDQIKDTYCGLRNIPLLRIRYDDNNIEEKLKNFLFN